MVSPPSKPSWYTIAWYAPAGASFAADCPPLSSQLTALAAAPPASSSSSSPAMARAARVETALAPPAPAGAACTDSRTT